MSRSSALGLFAATALVIGGCAKEGSYRVTWSFPVDTTANAALESAAVGCGQHGVDSILVTGVDTTTDGDQVLAICTPGQVTRSVPAGSWTIQVEAVDVRNAVMPLVLPEMPIPVVVVDDGAVADLVVILTPPPACDDGIDNDGDGRVDLADPDCGNDPNGAHE